jgi:UDP-4-amino-4,6-dideoxy-N-acetyl-beta-L-altrosamine N-acetyltransferase
MSLEFKNFIYLNENEARDILELRNQNYIKENMKNGEKITLENHLRFINSLKNLGNKKYFAVLKKDRIIGALYFVKDEKLFWGLYFKNEANPIYKSLACYIFLNYIFSKFDEDLNSFIKKNNPQALSFNKSFGFHEYKSDEEYIYLKLSKKEWDEKKESKLLSPVKKYLSKTTYSIKE